MTDQHATSTDQTGRQADEATTPFTHDEVSTLRDAVQWAGFYAQRDGVSAGGPSFASIAAATAILERDGDTICHSRAVRALIDQTHEIAARRGA